MHSDGDIQFIFKTEASEVVGTEILYSDTVN